MSSQSGIEFADFIGLLSVYLGVENLEENRQQSEAQLKILRQNDIGAANDRQAAYLLEELGRKFDEQNKVLQEILKEVKRDGGIQSSGQRDRKR